MFRFSPLRYRTLLLVSAMAVLAGCRREPAPRINAVDTNVTPAPSPALPAPIAPTVAAPTAPVLKDVIETTPSYIIGISYPQLAARYPPLAKAVLAYAQATRAELMSALRGLDGKKPNIPFDLSLQFRSVVETPRVVAVAADGSSYTGGAHGAPLVERFVWLPKQQQMLAAEQLIPVATNWKPVSDYCREQLMTVLSQQLDNEGVDAAMHAERLRQISAMIAAGTTPNAQNFSRFEPVMNADGSLRALRFVFPPYQVGPYSDGTRTVEVPARVLLPLVATAYAPLFRAE